MALVFDLFTFSIVATLSICIVAVVLAIDRSTCCIAIEFGVFFFTGIFARAVESMLIFIHLTLVLIVIPFVMHEPGRCSETTQHGRS